MKLEDQLYHSEMTMVLPIKLSDGMGGYVSGLKAKDYLIGVITHWLANQMGSSSCTITNKEVTFISGDKSYKVSLYSDIEPLEFAKAFDVKCYNSEKQVEGGAWCFITKKCQKWLEDGNGMKTAIHYKDGCPLGVVVNIDEDED